MPKSDRRLYLLLACILVFCMGVVVLLNNRPTPQPLPCREGSSNHALPLGRDGEGSGGSAVLAPFDPNTIDSATLVSYGIAAWKVKNFMHYRAAGKVFRTPDDLLDTYGWEEADLEPLLPYIRIGQTPPHPSPRGGRGYSERAEHSTPRPTREGQGGGSVGDRPSFPEKFRTLTLVDVNTADTTTLQRIPGIGSYYSRSIVRLREKLGGIHSLEQLFEIRDFPESSLEWLEVQSPTLRKINPNNADFKTMAAHPYIGYDRTKLIQRRIRLYGPFKDKQELIDAGIFTEEELEPLMPYLSFE